MSRLITKIPNYTHSLICSAFERRVHTEVHDLGKEVEIRSKFGNRYVAVKVKKSKSEGYEGYLYDVVRRMGDTLADDVENAVRGIRKLEVKNL